MKASLCLVSLPIAASFHLSYSRVRGVVLYSSLGGDGIPPPRDGDKNEWDSFLNPEGEESENLRKAREYMSENSLPLSFDVEEPGEKEVVPDQGLTEDEQSSALVLGKQGIIAGEPTNDMIQRNPYMAVVTKLTPSELISKFTATAHPRVQNAVRTTILGLIGGLPKMAFDTTTITTGQRLASLMFQLQMTGYMFKNAEYRLSLQQSLGSERQVSSGLLLKGSADEEKIDPLKGKVKGKLRIKYGGLFGQGQPETSSESTPEPTDGVELEVDAAAYMSELRSEVEQLRDELMITRKAKEEALRKDLLTYIRTLPPQELRGLTSTVSEDVLVAMKGMVKAVLSGIGDEDQIGPDTVTEQSGEAMAQLCMWQLVVGYNLRTLEVREEMRKSLSPSFDDKSSQLPGAFE